mmetsp:Transcript_83248/g.235833  ORF Transcript_83248/g.235833 Transcript_83248/m.235833 type:complete len:355 (+) Transcript_83248:354-1418(+)
MPALAGAPDARTRTRPPTGLSPPPHGLRNKAAVVAVGKLRHLLRTAGNLILQHLLLLCGAKLQGPLDDMACILVPSEAPNFRPQGLNNQAPLVICAVFQDVLDNKVAVWVLRQVHHVAQELGHEQQGARAVVLQEPLEDAAAEAVASGLASPACELGEDELHLARWHKHDALLQHVVRVGRSHRLPDVAVKRPRQSPSGWCIRDFQGRLEYPAPVLRHGHRPCHSRDLLQYLKLLVFATAQLCHRRIGIPRRPPRPQRALGGLALGRLLRPRLHRLLRGHGPGWAGLGRGRSGARGGHRDEALEGHQGRPRREGHRRQAGNAHRPRCLVYRLSVQVYVEELRGSWSRRLRDWQR